MLFVERKEEDWEEEEKSGVVLVVRSWLSLRKRNGHDDCLVVH